MAAAVALSSHQTSPARFLLCWLSLLLTARVSSSTSSRLPNIRELIQKQSRTHNLPGLKAGRLFCTHILFFLLHSCCTSFCCFVYIYKAKRILCRRGRSGKQISLWLCGDGCCIRGNQSRVTRRCGKKKFVANSRQAGIRELIVIRQAKMCLGEETTAHSGRREGFLFIHAITFAECCAYVFIDSIIRW